MKPGQFVDSRPIMFTFVQRSEVPTSDDRSTAEDGRVGFGLRFYRDRPLCQPSSMQGKSSAESS